MINRWMAVVLGAAVLAVPGTALAKGDHAKGKGHEKTHKVEKHGKKDTSSKGKSAKKGKTYNFKGLYKGEGVVTVSSGNSRVRKGGFVGTDVTFDLSAAKVVAADTDGVAGVTLADVKVGDKVLVQARLPRGTKAPEATTEAPTATESTDEPVADEAPAALEARKLVVLSRSSVSDDEAEQQQEPEHVEAPESE